MATENALIRIPAFHYRGFNIPALEIQDPPIADLGTSEPAYRLASKSAPLVHRVALYEVGMDLSLDKKDAHNLPEPVKQAGNLVYADAQKKLVRGVWHKDGALFVPKSEAPRGMHQMPEPWALARYSTTYNTKDFGWDADPLYVWLPKGNGYFIVPTGDGTHHPVTGTPLETVENMEEALQRWEAAGLTRKQAVDEISRFYSRESPGFAMVESRSSGLGPLCISLLDGPQAQDPTIGSFPANSLV